MVGDGSILEYRGDDDDDDQSEDPNELHENGQMELLRCSTVRHFAYRYRVRSMEPGTHCYDDGDDRGECPSDLHVAPNEGEHNPNLQYDDGVQHFVCQYCVHGMELDRHCDDVDDDDQDEYPSDLHVAPNEGVRSSGLQYDDGVQLFVCQNCVHGKELDRHRDDVDDDGQGGYPSDLRVAPNEGEHS